MAKKIAWFKLHCKYVVNRQAFLLVRRLHSIPAPFVIQVEVLCSSQYVLFLPSLPAALLLLQGSRVMAGWGTLAKFIPGAMTTDKPSSEVLHELALQMTPHFIPPPSVSEIWKPTSHVQNCSPSLSLIQTILLLCSHPICQPNNFLSSHPFHHTQLV